MVGDTTTVVIKLEAIAAREAHDPLRPRALHRLGLVFFEQGNYDASLATLRRFLEDYPENDAVRRGAARDRVACTRSASASTTRRSRSTSRC